MDFNRFKKFLVGAFIIANTNSCIQIPAHAVNELMKKDIPQQALSDGCQLILNKTRALKEEVESSTRFSTNLFFGDIEDIENAKDWLQSMMSSGIASKELFVRIRDLNNRLKITEYNGLIEPYCAPNKD